MGFSRREHWSGLLFPYPGGLPDPGIKPGSPALAGGFFIIWATREAPIMKKANRKPNLNHGEKSFSEALPLGRDRRAWDLPCHLPAALLRPWGSWHPCTHVSLVPAAWAGLCHWLTVLPSPGGTAVLPDTCSSSLRPGYPPPRRSFSRGEAQSFLLSSSWLTACFRFTDTHVHAPSHSCSSTLMDSCRDVALFYLACDLTFDWSWFPCLQPSPLFLSFFLWLCCGLLLKAYRLVSCGGQT